MPVRGIVRGAPVRGDARSGRQRRWSLANDRTGWFWRGVKAVEKEDRAASAREAAAAVGHFWKEPTASAGCAPRARSREDNAKAVSGIVQARTLVEALGNLCPPPLKEEQVEAWNSNTLLKAVTRCAKLIDHGHQGTYEPRDLEVLLYAVEGRLKYTAEVYTNNMLLSLTFYAPLVVAHALDELPWNQRRAAAACAPPAAAAATAAAVDTLQDEGGDGGDVPQVDVLDGGDVHAALEQAGGGAEPAGTPSSHVKCSSVHRGAGDRMLAALEAEVIQRGLHRVADKGRFYELARSVASAAISTRRPMRKVLAALQQEMRAALTSSGANYISGACVGPLFFAYKIAGLLEPEDLLLLRRRLLELGAGDFTSDGAVQLLEVLRVLVDQAGTEGTKRGLNDAPEETGRGSASPMARLRHETSQAILSFSGMPFARFAKDVPLLPALRRHVDAIGEVIVEEMARRADMWQWTPRLVSNIIASMDTLRLYSSGLLSLVTHQILAKKWTAFSTYQAASSVRAMARMTVFLGGQSVLLRTLERDLPALQFPEKRYALVDVVRIAGALAHYSEPSRETYQLLGDAFLARARIPPGLGETQPFFLAAMVKAFGAATCSDMKVYLHCLGAAVQQLLAPTPPCATFNHRACAMNLMYGVHYGGRRTDALVEKLEDVLLSRPVYTSLDAASLAQCLGHFAEWHAVVPRFVERFDEYLYEHTPAAVLGAREFDSVVTAFRKLRHMEPKCYLADTAAEETKAIGSEPFRSIRQTSNVSATRDLVYDGIDAV